MGVIHVLPLSKTHSKIGYIIEARCSIIRVISLIINKYKNFPFYND